MLRNLIILSLAVGLFFQSTALKAQRQNGVQPVAQIKYKISDYKNPSIFTGRRGLARFSADDKLLAVIGDKERIVISDTETGKVLQTISYAEKDFSVNAFSFGADGKTVLVQDGLSTSIDVWDLETGKVLYKIDGRTGVSGLKKELITSLAQKNSGQELRELPISPDGKNILVGKSDSLFEVVSLADGATRFSLSQSSKSSDTKDLLKIFLIPGAVYKTVYFLSSNASYNLQGNRIMLANGDKFPTLWDAETGKLIAKLEPQNDKVYQANFSSNGRLIATTDVDGVTKIWDAETGAIIQTIGTPKKKERAIAWHPREEILATFLSDEEVHFYEARSGRLLSGTGKINLSGLSFSPDGNLITTLTKDDKSKLGQIFSVADGKLIASLRRQTKEEQPLSLKWSPNGKLFVISSVEYVKIFNERGEFLQSLDSAVFPARFSHDGKFLATGGKNDDGFVWQIDEK